MPLALMRITKGFSLLMDTRGTVTFRTGREAGAGAAAAADGGLFRGMGAFNGGFFRGIGAFADGGGA